MTVIDDDTLIDELDHSDFDLDALLDDAHDEFEHMVPLPDVRAAFSEAREVDVHIHKYEDNDHWLVLNGRRFHKEIPLGQQNFVLLNAHFPWHEEAALNWTVEELREHTGIDVEDYRK